MRSWRLRYFGSVILLLVVSIIGASYVSATTSSSTNYQTTQTHFGPASTSHSCSGSYCSEVSIGSAGATPSTGYSTSFTSAPDGKPSLSMIIDPGVSNLGVLSTDATAYKIMTVKVRSQLSGGYTLQVVGDAPHVGSNYLKTSASPVASQPGHEQFGVNVVKNTSPKVGSDPNQIVKGSSGDGGKVASNYGSANKFMYHPDDLVASSGEQSSETSYTISMIINISGSTVPGHYAGDFQILMMPGF